MTLAAEIRGYDDHDSVRAYARLVVRPHTTPIIVELSPDGGRLASGMLEPQLVGPDGTTVHPSDGADYLRVLRWARSSERLWITTLAELPDDTAIDPATSFPDVSEPSVPATVPYPMPPAPLTELDIVEICRPRPDDLLKVEVVARVVRRGRERPTLEVLTTGEAPVIEQRLLRLESEGSDPLEELVRDRIRPDLAGRRVRFDRPFDRASRDAVVALRRTIQGDTKRSVQLLDMEYETRLPRLWLSRCPFSGTVLRMAVDAFDFDGPWFDARHPLRPTDDALPATFLALTGDAPPRADSSQPASPWSASAPWVAVDALIDPGVRAVLSAIRVGKHIAWLVAYFAERAPADFPLMPEWGCEYARVPRASGADGFVPAPGVGRMDYALEPWIRSGRLSWIEPLDMTATLRSGIDGFPYRSRS